MFSKLRCTNCGYKMRFNRKEAWWHCDNCGDIITMEEMVQREYYTPSGAIKPKAVRHAVFAIILICAIFFTVFIGTFIFVNTVRHNVTISVFSQDYNGPVKIYIDDREVHSDEIIVGETIEKTFSLSGGRHFFTISYGDEEINWSWEITYDEDFSYNI